MNAAGNLVVAGRIATLGGPGLGLVEAVAIRDGTVVAAGRLDDVATAAPDAERLQLRTDEIAIPGFTDAHLHLGDAALAAQQLDLETAWTLDEALALVRTRHERSAPDEWLLGHGWNGAAWGRWPTADDLERVAPGRSVFLWSHDHHSAWLSPAALARAGVAGEGVLREGDIRPAADAVPAPSQADLERAIEAYARSLLALGIVAVHDPGPLAPDPSLRLDMAACAALAEAGRLPIRVHVSVREDSLATAIERGLRSGDDLVSPNADSSWRGRCRVGWLKLFADGALGSRTAALLEPYEREAVALPGGPRGVLTTGADELTSLVGTAAAGGIATQIHAIGDRAVRAALDAFTAVSAARELGARARIEHAQLVDPADFDRFAALGVVASVQPSHVLSDAAAAVAAWGDRAERNGYPYGELDRAGALLAFGSDAPVERADPWVTLAAAIHRARSSAAAPLLGRDQRLPIVTALRAACSGPAAAAGDATAGRLAPGSPGDLVIVDAGALEEPFAARPSVVIAAGVPLEG